jgi:hypothetical protein
MHLPLKYPLLVQPWLHLAIQLFRLIWHFAGKARNYGLHTESSLRFERGVDFAITEVAIERATQLIIAICGGQNRDTHSFLVHCCIDTYIDYFLLTKLSVNM